MGLVAMLVVRVRATETCVRVRGDREGPGCGIQRR